MASPGVDCASSLALPRRRGAHLLATPWSDPHRLRPPEDIWSTSDRRSGSLVDTAPRKEIRDVMQQTRVVPHSHTQPVTKSGEHVARSRLQMAHQGRLNEKKPKQAQDKTDHGQNNIKLDGLGWARLIRAGIGSDSLSRSEDQTTTQTEGLCLSQSR